MNKTEELVLYDVDEVAEILHLKRTTVFNMIAAGEIDSFKMRNKKRMFTQEAIDTYINKQKETLE
tara:strand:- start:883 stop:1077 length:195 start_codon:yes stop_codon:yes gene_type:complete